MLIATAHIFLILWMLGNWNVMISCLFILVPLISLRLYRPWLSIFRVDTFSVRLIILVLWVTAVSIIRRTYILHKNIKPAQYYHVFILIAVLLLFSFLVSDLLSFYILFESRLIPVIVLIIIWGINPERLNAGMYIIIYTLIGSLPILISILYVRSEIGSLNFYLRYNYTPSPIITFFLLLALLIKLPLYSIHLWLPKAHVEAPVGGRIMLAGLILKLGPYGIVRIVTMLPAVGLWWQLPLLVMSLIRRLIAALICIRQVDIKSLVAYASISHIRLVRGSLITFTHMGWVGAKIIILAHGLTSAGLFALVNFIYENTHSRSLVINRGLIHVWPTTRIWWFLFIIANIAIPPMSNFTAELFIYMRLVSLLEEMAIGFGVLYSVVTLFYSVFLYTSLHHGEMSPHIRFIAERPIYFTISFLLFAPLLFVSPLRVIL